MIINKQKARHQPLFILLALSTKLLFKIPLADTEYTTPNLM
jgi:hypothetical protein